MRPAPELSKLLMAFWIYEIVTRQMFGRETSSDKHIVSENKVATPDMVKTAIYMFSLESCLFTIRWESSLAASKSRVI